MGGAARRGRARGRAVGGDGGHGVCRGRGRARAGAFAGCGASAVLVFLLEDVVGDALFADEVAGDVGGELGLELRVEQLLGARGPGFVGPFLRAGFALVAVVAPLQALLAQRRGRGLGRASAGASEHAACTEEETAPGSTSMESLRCSPRFIRYNTTAREAKDGWTSSVPNVLEMRSHVRAPKVRRETEQQVGVVLHHPPATSRHALLTASTRTRPAALRRAASARAAWPHPPSPLRRCARPAVWRLAAHSPLRAQALRQAIVTPATLLLAAAARPALLFSPVECRHTTMSSSLALATATFLEHPVS